MNEWTCRVLVAVPALGLLLASGCQGDGSDIGPRLDKLPDASGKVLVVDNEGRGVCGAKVEFGGATARTGRSGRGDFFANPTGTSTMSVDASAAASVSGGRLASLQFRAEVAGADVPFPVHLPDTGRSQTLVVPTGVPQGAVTLDDTGESGVQLGLVGGTVVTQDGASSVTFRLAKLDPGHLPGILPAATNGAMLFSRGVFIDPPGALVSAPATLRVTDDLQLGVGQQANLYYLDQVTKTWVTVGTTTTSAAGVLQQDAAVSAGGLYVFGIEVPAAATVRGRILDVEGRVVPDALVCVDWLRTKSLGDGSFSVSGVAATWADGAQRQAICDVYGGAGWVAARATVSSPNLSNNAVVDASDIELDTQPGGDLRVQLVREGFAAPYRSFAVSATDGAYAARSLVDARGQCRFDDIPNGYFGFMQGESVDSEVMFVGEAVGYVPPGRRRSELYAFFDDRTWFVGSRNTRTLVIDSVGGGPIRDAYVVRGDVDEEGFVGTTREGGVVFTGRDFAGRATAVKETVSGELKLVSAFSIVRPNGDRLELPLDRALRSRGGQFDRHGVAEGELLGFVGPAAQLRASRMLTIEQWFDWSMLDVDPESAVPVSRQGSSYRVGVPQPYGSISIAEDLTGGPSFTLDKLGLRSMLTLPEAEVTTLDIDVDLVSDTIFRVEQGQAGLDASLQGPNPFTFDLGLLLPNGLVVDVARSVGGNVSQVGFSDVDLLLPGLVGDLAGASWLVVLKAQGPDADQRIFVRFDSPTPVRRQQLPLATIQAPLPGGSVDAAGFDVDYELPSGSLYGTLELTSPAVPSPALDQPGLEWTVVVPADGEVVNPPNGLQTRFPKMPVTNPIMPSPLVAGRNYFLTLSAARADEGVLLQTFDPYISLTTFWQSISAYERGVVAVSRQRISISTP